MNKELLEQIRKEYKDYSKMTLKDYSELEELERNPIVIRYKYLLKLKDDIARSNFYDGKDPNYTCEVISKYGRGSITETNNIWCWLVDISARKYETIFNKALDDFSRNDLVSVYRDLENSKKTIVIPYTEQASFEATHKVVRGKRYIADFEDRYCNTRYPFFDLCLKESEEAAITFVMAEEQKRQNEVEAQKKEELANLDFCLNQGVITEEHYNNQKRLILAKK